MDQPLQTIEGENAVERFVYASFIAGDGRLRAFWRFVLSLIVFVLANVAAGLFASIAGRARIVDLIYRPLALVFVLAGFALLLKLADGVPGPPLSSMGLSFGKPWLRDAAWGSLLGFVLIFVAYLVIRFTCELTVNITINGRRTATLVFVELAILASAAMLEEVAFRGYPFQRLLEMFNGAARFVIGDKLGADTIFAAQSFAAIAASVLWSVAFGAVHLWNPSATVWSFLNTSLVGVLFCIAYLRTRSLWMPWGIHFAWNTTLGLVLGLPVSGVRQFSVIVRSKADGPLWITGGAYGIEGSVLGTSVIVLGIVLVLLFVKPRPVTAASNNATVGLDESNSERIQL